MNSRSALAIVLLAGSIATSTIAANTELQTPFGQMTEDYKKGAEISATLFNPFKVQVVHGDDHSNVATVTDDAVRAALTQRGLSGLVIGAAAGDSRAIIGNEIFTIGDELQFTDDKGANAPLVPNATVVLRAITKQTLVLELSCGGEAVHPVNYPLRSFLAP